jgi:hypothetical protein
MQRHEHDTLRRLTQKTTESKRRMLEVLSQWLLSQPQDGAGRAEAERLSGCSLDEWFRLQNEHERLAAEARHLHQELDSAEAALDAEFPRWSLARYLPPQPLQARLAALTKAVRTKRDEVVKADARLELNDAQRREFGKTFLRGCMASVQELEHSTVFGDELRDICVSLTRAIQAEWLQHRAAIHEGLATIERGCHEIRAMYEDERK